VALLTLWSPKGGSGTSVFAAAAALVLARERGSRLVDLCGDQPAIFGIGAEPARGVTDWLDVGPDAPTDALDRLALEAAPGLALIPYGDEPAALAPRPAAEAGAALAVALDADPRPGACDLGRLDDPARLAFAQVAGSAIVVVRGCYLALRRAVHHEAIELARGAILIDEHGRSLGARDVEDVLGLPVLATIEARTSIARAVDAGVLNARMPDALARPLRHALVGLGCLPGERAA
jgi:hypothetical protein